MDRSHSLTKLMRLTSEIARESAKLQTRARETLSQSAAIMDRSKYLLSLWPVSGTPAFPEATLAEPADVASQAAPPDQAQAPPAHGGAALERIAERDFLKELVRLDGRHFVDCKVEDCVLEYCGGPVILEGTHFVGCRFRFGGEAATTVSMLGCFGLIDTQSLEPASATPRAAGTGRVN